METLREAYQMAKRNDGAPGIDGVTFEAIEESGAESFLMQIREELDHRSLNNNTFEPIYVLMGHALPEEAQSPPIQ